MIGIGRADLALWGRPRWLLPDLPLFFIRIGKTGSRWHRSL